MTELWLIVGQYALFEDTEPTEVEWVLTAGVDMDYRTAGLLLTNHIKEVSEVDDVEDIHLDGVYFNRYTEVDGYDITLTEKEST